MQFVARGEGEERSQVEIRKAKLSERETQRESKRKRERECENSRQREATRERWAAFPGEVWSAWVAESWWGQACFVSLLGARSGEKGREREGESERKSEWASSGTHASLLGCCSVGVAGTEGGRQVGLWCGYTRAIAHPHTHTPTQAHTHISLTHKQGNN